MLTKYIDAAMHHATYKILEDDTFFGEIPVTPGVWANAATLEACRDELQSVLEDWLMLSLADHDELPTIDGIAITATVAA